MTAWAIFTVAVIVSAWLSAPWWVTVSLALGAVIAVAVDE